jgi:hypothetical protein
VGFVGCRNGDLHLTYILLYSSFVTTLCDTELQSAPSTCAVVPACPSVPLSLSSFPELSTFPHSLDPRPRHMGLFAIRLPGLALSLVLDSAYLPLLACFDLTDVTHPEAYRNRCARVTLASTLSCPSTSIEYHGGCRFDDTSMPTAQLTAHPSIDRVVTPRHAYFAFPFSVLQPVQVASTTTFSTFETPNSHLLTLPYVLRISSSTPDLTNP